MNRGTELSRPVRVGMMSFAHMHAYSYASALKKLEGVEFCGIADDNRERGEAAAERFGTEFFADYEKLLDQKLDCVIICSENRRHKELTLLAADRGAHVLCEKPIAADLDEARAMITACRKAGVQLATAFPMRYNPPVRRAREIVTSGKIGRVLAISGTNRGRMPGGWFIDEKLSGGGAIIDHTVHVVDLMRWFLGREVRQVYAEIDTLLHPGLGIDDCGILTMEIEGGVVATLDPSWSRPKTFPTWGDVTMLIVGTAGNLKVDAFAQNITVYSDKDNITTWDYWGGNADLGMVSDFIEKVRSGEPVSVTGEDGFRALEVALGAYRSAREGKPVALGEPI